MRWIMDVLTYARDKQVNGGLCFSILYKRHQLLHPARAALIGHVRVPDSPPKHKVALSTYSLNEVTADKTKIVPSIKISSCPRNVSESSLNSVTDPLMLGQHHAQIKKSNSVGSNFCVPDFTSDLYRRNSMGSIDSRSSGESQQTLDDDDDMGITMRSSSSSDPLSEQRLSATSLEGSLKSPLSLASLEEDSRGSLCEQSLSVNSLEGSVRSLPVHSLVEGKSPIRSHSNTSLNCQRGQFREKPRKSRSTESADPEAYVFKRPHSAMSDQSSASTQTVGADGHPRNIVRVYAAYSSGLPTGTSVKLHITSRTTAREVVNLVVQQLNMAVIMKEKVGGPIYSNQELVNFCLVSVVGARERCLRDDFRPLQLQNPWTNGKLYVRIKSDVLAAIEQNSSYSGRNSAFL